MIGMIHLVIGLLRCGIVEIFIQITLGDGSGIVGQLFQPSDNNPLNEEEIEKKSQSKQAQGYRVGKDGNHLFPANGWQFYTDDATDITDFVIECLFIAVFADHFGRRVLWLSMALQATLSHVYRPRITKHLAFKPADLFQVFARFE